MNKSFLRYGILIPVAAVLATFSSCDKDKVENPDPNEQELITTIRLDLTPTSGGTTQHFVYKVENGIGSSTPGTIQIDTVKLAPVTSYNAVIVLLNEKAQPVEDITGEVISEKDEHLFFLAGSPASGAGSVSTSGGSVDNNGKPFNQTFTLTSGAAGSGNFTVTLLHEPTDKDATTVAGAGGETDAEGVFPVRIQ